MPSRRSNAATCSCSAGVSSRIGMSVRCTPGAHDLARAEVPLVVFVAVLPLRADVGDFFAHAGGHVEVLAAPAIAAQLVARGFGPHAAGEQLEQLRLAGAIAADEQPALSGLDAPVHIAQHRALAAIEVDAPEREGRDECAARALGMPARELTGETPPARGAQETLSEAGWSAGRRASGA